MTTSNQPNSSGAAPDGKSGFPTIPTLPDISLPPRHFGNGSSHEVTSDQYLSPTSASKSFIPPAILPSGSQSLAGVSTRAFFLGGVAGISFLITLSPFFSKRLIIAEKSLVVGETTTQPLVLTAPGFPLPPLAFWALALSTFHFLEFWVTAQYNTACATTASFLLTSNGLPYTLSQLFASVEYIVGSVVGGSSGESAFVDGGWSAPFAPAVYRAVGLGLVLLGQTIRTLAMRRAGRSFNHTVQVRRGEGHVLVTEGIYAWLRHPAYFGFFWWAVGTQIWLGNRLMLVVYVCVLWRFFSRRIEGEEQALITFFGDDYRRYRQKTSVGIPFIP